MEPVKMDGYSYQHLRELLYEERAKNEQLQAHTLRLEEAVKNGLEYVRCGIGANYSGENFEPKMDSTYLPIVEALKESPAQSLAEHDADLLTRIATDIRNGIDAGDTANDAGVVEYIAGCIDEEAARMLKQADSKQGEV